ncbi:MAG: hypothetical protein ABI119_02495 [Gemmatimonadaceae bacterium]
MPSPRVRQPVEMDSQPASSVLSEQQPVNTLTVWRAIRPHWRLIATIAVVGLVVGATPGMLRNRTYTSELSFASQSRATNAVSALASQFGLQGGGDPVQSPAFYADLVASRAILEPLLASRPAGMRPGMLTLEQQLAPDEKEFGKRRQKAMEKLSSAIRTSVNAATSVVTVKVTTESPRLSQDLGASLIAAINLFNVRRRQDRAAADKQFAEQQLAEAGADVRAAENRLASFLNENRSRVAPRLSLDEERLRRDIATRQQLYTSLMQDYQTAKINEARNDPAITLIDPPQLPYVGDSRGTVVGGALGLFGGVAIGLALVYGQAFLALRRENIRSSGEAGT